MKDLHCHLLPGIDDGSKDLRETIHILKRAQKEGVTDIILTPHYIEDSKFMCNNKEKQELYDRLMLLVESQNIDINLYLGNEVYITNNFLKLLDEGEITTLNSSKYLLLEFPIENMYRNTKDILYDLIKAGYVPILAHPERYTIFQHHPEYMEEYLRMGVLLQGNYKSLFGKYGSDAKKTLKCFLKMGWITFLGSDNHHDEDYDIKKLRKKLKSIVKDDDIVDDLLENNFDKVINDEDIGIIK